jgi:mRNA interferase MazF
LAPILRGDIVWADLGPARGSEQTGRRPVLVLSHDVFNARSGTVIALAITGKPPRAGFPLTLPLSSPALPKPSWAKISQIRTLSTDRLGHLLARASNEELTQVLEGLWEIIGGA